jgi:tetratricopeptide (TPR) repeat protein
VFERLKQQSIPLTITIAIASVTGPVMAAPAANAKPASSDVLLFSRVGKGTTRQSRLVERLAVAFTRVGYPIAVGKSLKQKIERAISLPAGSVDGLDTLQKAFKDGQTAFIEGDYEQAIRLLKVAPEVIAKRGALLAQNQSARSLVRCAMMYLANAYLRQKQAARAQAVLRDVIRWFPDNPPKLIRFAPDLVSAYRDLARQLRRAPEGTLNIQSKPRACLVFLNGRFVGMSPTRVLKLLPGVHYLYLSRSGKAGRMLRFDIAAGEKKVLVDFDLDRVLRTDTLVGLAYENDQQMKAERTNHAAKVALALKRARVFLSFVAHIDGKRALVGQLLDVSTRRVLRHGAVSVQPKVPSDQALESLARFLVSGNRQPGVTVFGQKQAAPTKKAPSDNSGYVPWAWTSWGVGLAAGGVAAYVLAIDGEGIDCVRSGVSQEEVCQSRRNTAALGWSLAGVGAAAVITGTVLYILSRRGRKERKKSASSFQITPAGAGLQLRATF